MEPKGSPHLDVNPWGKIRLNFSDGTLNLDLSVTDIRLVEKDHKTPRHSPIESVASRFQRTAAILAVGLARPWLQPGDSAERQWLQVNNIHLKDDPLGEVFDWPGH
jgi:hypothetical protein